MNTMLWEFYALGYDALCASLPHKKIRESVIRIIGEKKYDTILDLGCGTGTMLFSLSRNNEVSKMVGIDFTWTMIAICQLKQLLWQRANLHFMRKSINNLDFISESSIDIVYSINTLFALPHPATTVTKVSKIIKDDGVVVLALPTEKFSFTKMAKEHISLLTKLTLINQILNFGANLLLLPLWLIVGIANLFISLKEKRGSYTTYDKKKVIAVIDESELYLKEMIEILSGQMMIIKLGKNK